MTVKEKLIAMLVTNGMFESQAVEVIDLAIPELNKLVDNYAIQFDSNAEGYPNMLYSLWFENIKPIALKWIDENKPQAWFRPMFV